MLRRSLGSVLISASLASSVTLGGAAVALAQTPPAITVTTLAERVITPAQLPAGTLVWRLETLPTGDAAVAATGSSGVAAAFGGRNYLLTLGRPGGATPGATRIAETGAVPVPRNAAQIALRISSLTGAAGAQSAVHMHPGAEGYYTTSGTFGARSQAGTVGVPAGRTFVGPASGTAVQAVNLGATDLQVLVFFALDAGQPASSMATFADPTAAARVSPGAIGLPATGGGPIGATGGAAAAVIPGAAVAGLIAAAGLIARLRRRS